jgi:hypothetical protein
MLISVSLTIRAVFVFAYRIEKPLTCRMSKYRVALGRKKFLCAKLNLMKEKQRVDPNRRTSQ